MHITSGRTPNTQKGDWMSITVSRFALVATEGYTGKENEE
jgi:hypothetical protein